MPFRELALRPRSPQPTENDTIRKPLFQIGERVCAAHSASSIFSLGVIKNYTFQNDKDYGYGPLILYDVLFDDGTIGCSIEDSYCILKEDFNRVEKEWRGVTSKHDVSSKDRWAKEMGWFTVCLDGTERSFPRLTDAIRAYDKDVVRRKGPQTVAGDLNLPEDWDWLPRIKSGEREANRHDDSEDDADGENVSPNIIQKKVISPVIRTKKKSKSWPVDSFPDSPEPTTKKRKTSTATPRTLEAARHRCIDYNGVSFTKSNSKYLSYVNMSNKMHALSSYHLAADAAYVFDRVNEEFKGPDKKRNFASQESYLEARTQEMREVGIGLDVVGTIEGLNVKIAEQIAKVHRDVDGKAKPKSKRKRESTELPERNTSKARKPKPTVSDLPDGELDDSYFESPEPPKKKKRKSTQQAATPRTLEASRKRCLDYKGVSFTKANSKYMSYVTMNNKMHALSSYYLAADAAHVSDQVNEEFRGPGKTRNFESLQTFQGVRTQEMREVGIGLDVAGTIEELNIKIAEQIAKVHRDVDGKAKPKNKSKGTIAESKPLKQSNGCADTTSEPIKKKRKRKSKSTQQAIVDLPRGSVAMKSDVELDLKQRSRSYLGVSFQSDGKKYRSSIMIDKLRNLGVFKLAADAAYVTDKVIAELKPAELRRNFSTLEKYYAARNQEMTKVGLTLDGVGTVATVNTKAEAKIATIRDEMRRSTTIAGTVTSEVEDAPLAAAAAAPAFESKSNESNADISVPMLSFSKENAESQPGNDLAPSSTPSYNCSNYQGVYFHKRDKRFQARHNSKYLGYFRLVTDAAFCYDTVQENTNGPGSRVNFATEEQWQVARVEEIKYKGLGAVGTSEEIKAKISAYVKKETETA